MEIFDLMEFYCVYVKTRKKLDKYVKVNRIKNKYIVDIKKILEEEEIDFDKFLCKTMDKYMNIDRLKRDA